MCCVYFKIFGFIFKGTLSSTLSMDIILQLFFDLTEIGVAKSLRTFYDSRPRCKDWHEGQTLTNHFNVLHNTMKYVQINVINGGLYGLDGITVHQDGLIVIHWSSEVITKILNCFLTNDIEVTFSLLNT